MSGGAQKLWGDVSGGRLAEAQKFADQGQWGQAAQQYQLGGGQSFTQPQYQAFTQQDGNAGSPAGQLGGVFGQPVVSHLESFEQPGAAVMGSGGVGPPGGVDYYPGEIIADGPGSGMWGPPAQAQPLPPMNIPGQQPMIPPPQVAQPTPPTMGTGGFTGHHNVSAGRLAEAQRLGKIAGVGGNMGLAKQQWELGGGKWSPDAHMFLDGRLAGGGLLS